MTTKPPKRPRDPNQLAKAIVDIATGQVEETGVTVAPSTRTMIASAAGKARAKALAPERRSAIAASAARTRWKSGAHSD